MEPNYDVRHQVQEASFIKSVEGLPTLVSVQANVLVEPKPHTPLLQENTTKESFEKPQQSSQSSAATITPFGKAPSPTDIAKTTKFSPVHCSHHHYHPTSEQKLEGMIVGSQLTSHTNQTYHTPHNHQHLPSCQFYSHPTTPITQHPQLTRPVQPLQDISVGEGIPEAILDYLKGDLHRTWRILDKLSKAKLVDKKLEGVFILKELGLNKGVTALKCLTSNGGDVPKTLQELKPKDNNLSAKICYVTSLPEEQHVVVIDGFSVAVSDASLRTLCLSSRIEERNKAVILMYMLIEVCSGLFLIPREYMTPHVFSKIKETLSNLKTKSTQPMMLRLCPIVESVQVEVVNILRSVKPEERKRYILASESQAVMEMCVQEFPEVRVITGENFLQSVTKSQDKKYINQLISLQ